MAKGKPVDHRAEAERMVTNGMAAGTCTAETRAMLAAAHGSLAVCERLDRLYDSLGRLTAPDPSRGLGSKARALRVIDR